MHTSAEGKLIQACSEKIGIPIIIWSWSHEEAAWQRATIAGTRHRKPVTLLLRDRHYCVLKPPEGVDLPSSWLRECRISDVDLTGAGVSDH